MASASYILKSGLKIHERLAAAVDQVAAGTSVSTDHFWSSLCLILQRFTKRNKDLLATRERLQKQIDHYHLAHSPRSSDWNPKDYESFLQNIGYIVPEPRPFRILTSTPDEEISSIPGPQLVVPVDNARYAINAANARWGSLLDAFYGTDAGPEDLGAEIRSSGDYNPVRGAFVFEMVHDLLDAWVPLTNLAVWKQVRGFEVLDGQLRFATENGPCFLQHAHHFCGYQGSSQDPSNILLTHNSLRIEIQVDRDHSVGRTHRAGIKDVLLESAVSVVADCEDSVAAVDAEDKANVYTNWAGLMRGDLVANFEKKGSNVCRRLAEDRFFSDPSGKRYFLVHSKATMLVRNVGIHMFTDAVLTAHDNCSVPEGILDAMVTTLAGIHGLRRKQHPQGIYIVKPKLHGPDELQFVVDLFAAVEDALGLPKNTIKLGIMDEERRTSLNLAACLEIAKHRIVFINTGFLDRTGDEIHTSFCAGPMRPKYSIETKWYDAYERSNVAVGMKYGLIGKGQIGKGMWAAPGSMKEMLRTKHFHLTDGATTSWVPSPTAATLHAIHYHKFSVKDTQRRMLQRPLSPSMHLPDLLNIPIMPYSYKFTLQDLYKELVNNAQSILGYVVRWVQLGIGCSTVPDSNDVGLMEDRATLRISSQLLANWIHHKLVSREAAFSVFQDTAATVDRQNSKTAGYVPMCSDLGNSIAFRCAWDLVSNGATHANGYTEDSLARHRRMEKQARIKPSIAKAKL